jgi:hypothetical protein
LRSILKRGAVGLACISLAVAAPTAAVQATSGPATAVAAHSCSAGYTHASLSWGHKCLRAGQFCKKGASANRQYHRYGFHCPRSGHLTYY